MILDALQPWLCSSSLLLTSQLHANTSPALTHLLVHHLKNKRRIHLLHHHAANSRTHYNALLAKCSVDASALVASGLLRYTEAPCFLDAPPDLELLYSALSEADVAVLADVHVLLGLGCALRDIVLLVQRLLREGCVVVATSRVAPETAQLNTFLHGLLGDVTCLDTLASGASVEIDGHITLQRGGYEKKGLYKASEKGIKIFPMGAAPGMV